ncbi:diaminopimelate decarboxylase [candidate division KSB1 bacterium]|nr:diaminopimelate decarboxylase [candidate division KSB1 bacterium]
MLAYKNGSIYWGNVDLSLPAQKWGTPFYVYNRSTLEESFTLLQSRLRPEVNTICYALKANSNPHLVGCLAGLGAGADIVSMGELIAARKAKIPAGKIVFSGAGKSDEELRFALKEGVGAINVESKQELDAIERISADLKTKAPVMLRVNPDIDPQSHPLISTGKNYHKFGISLDSIPEFATRCKKSGRIEFLGLHVHIGSQISRFESIDNTFKVISNLVKSIEKQGIPIRNINIGGGLPVDYESAGKSLLSGGCTGMDTGLEKATGYWKTCIKKHFDCTKISIVIEPGRSIIAHSGILLTRVIYRKRNNKKEFLIVDAGMNDFIRPALYGETHSIVPLKEPGNLKTTIDIAGPLCETGDVFARDISFPESDKGDVLAILSTGAYGFVLSSNYNLRLRPPELLIDNGEVACIRERESYDDII